MPVYRQTPGQTLNAVHNGFSFYFQLVESAPLKPLTILGLSMATTAQILANRQNAEKASGAVSAEGKARVSHNAMKFGLFSVANFVRPEERDIFSRFDSGYMAELSPATSLEQTLAREIIHAAWR